MGKNQDLAKGIFANGVTGVTKSMVGLGNVTNDAQVKTVSSTDNAVVRFDGTTGQVQNSSVVIDDVGNLTLQSGFANGGGISFRDGYSPSANIGIYAKDFSGSNIDGLGIAAYDGLSIHTGVGMNERMRIDSEGRVTMPYQPAFCVSGLSGTYVGPCTFPFNSFVLGVPSQKSINFNTGNGVFTAPISGLYQFNFNIYNHNANVVTYAVFKNGSGLVPSDWFQRQSGSVTMTTWSFVLYLNLNDYIQMGLRGGTVNAYSGHTYFSGYLIG